MKSQTHSVQYSAKRMFKMLTKETTQYVSANPMILVSNFSTRPGCSYEGINPLYQPQYSIRTYFYRSGKNQQN